MKVTIYHCEDTRESFFYRTDAKEFKSHDKICQMFLDGDYKQVGVIEDWVVPPGSVSLDCAYEQSQNIDSPWNPATPCRSTSVGDILEEDGEFWIVAPHGFDKLDIEGMFARNRAKYEAKKAART